MANLKPDEFYAMLYESASVRKKRTLEIIQEACKMQSRSDVKDYSLGTIAWLIKDKGGPSEQGLRNKNGEDYRALIKCWAEHCSTTTKKPRKQESKALDDVILENVSDPTTRALIGMILAQNRKLKNEISLLKEIGRASCRERV